MLKRMSFKQSSPMVQLTIIDNMHGTWELPALLTRVSDVQARPDKLEVVVSFCYLGDMLSAGRGCESVVTTCVIV